MRRSPAAAAGYGDTLRTRSAAAEAAPPPRNLVAVISSAECLRAAGLGGAERRRRRRAVKRARTPTPSAGTARDGSLETTTTHDAATYPVAARCTMRGSGAALCVRRPVINATKRGRACCARTYDHDSPEPVPLERARGMRMRTCVRASYLGTMNRLEEPELLLPRDCLRCSLVRECAWPTKLTKESRAHAGRRSARQQQQSATNSSVPRTPPPALAAKCDVGARQRTL